MTDRRPLRILFLARDYPAHPNLGGIGVFTRTIGPGLAALGHEVHVLSALPRQDHRDYVEHGVRIHRRPLMVIRRLGRVLPGPR